MIEKPRAYRRLAAIVLLCAAAGNCSADEAPAARGIAIPDLARTTPVDFAAEIVPILKANCLACHNANTTKGDLSLETPQSMLEGGTNGASRRCRRQQEKPAPTDGGSARQADHASCQQSRRESANSRATRPHPPVDRPGGDKLDCNPAHADRLATASAWAAAHPRRRRHAGRQVRGLQPGRSAFRLRSARRQARNPAGRSRTVGTGPRRFRALPGFQSAGRPPGVGWLSHRQALAAAANPAASGQHPR